MNEVVEAVGQGFCIDVIGWKKRTTAGLANPGVILVVGLKVGELSPKRSFAVKNSSKKVAHAFFEFSLREGGVKCREVPGGRDMAGEPSIKAKVPVEVSDPIHEYVAVVEDPGVRGADTGCCEGVDPESFDVNLECTEACVDET